MGTLKQGESDEFMDSIIDDLRTKSKEAGLKELDKMWESIDAEEVSEESSTTISNSTVTPTVEETIKKSIVEIVEHTKPKFIAKPFQKPKKPEKVDDGKNVDDEKTSVEKEAKKLVKQVKV